MSFFKGLGTLAGTVIGGVVGGTVGVVGEMVDSKFLKEIGEGVLHSSIRGCEIIGQAVDGATKVAGGVLNDDKLSIDRGFQEIGKSVGQTLTGIGTGIVNIAENGFDAINGLATGDEQKVYDSSKKIVKAVAIGVLAIGVCDVLDIAGDDSLYFADDDVAFDSDIDAEDIDTDGDGIEDVHHVDPHSVNGYIRADGTYVSGYWRDGDGNTAINLTEGQGGGYMRSNPS